MPLLPDATPKKITMSNCKPQINPLIVGGKNASITDYPHMVSYFFFFKGKRPDAFSYCFLNDGEISLASKANVC